MKFLHLGDIHLGKSLGDFSLNDDQKYILGQTLDIYEREKADALLIAGDVYDKAVPSEAATCLLDWFLNELAERKAPVFMISGNHDSDERLGYGSKLFRECGIHIATSYDGTLQKATVTDDYGEADIWMLPFVKASQVKHFFPEEKIESYDDAVRVVIANAGIDVSKRNIILSHQFVTGKNAAPALSGSESLGTKSVGQIELIGSDCFDIFDYAALGHIHSPQSVGREEVRYSGSPLKYSLSEVDNEKSVPVVTIKEKGSVDIDLVPLVPMRDMRHIKGPFSALVDPANVVDTQDFIYATLTDEDVINDAIGILQQYYPNTVKLDYDNSRTRQVSRVEDTEAKKEKTFAERASEFYRAIYGCDISEDEMNILKEIGKEAGIEAD